MVGKHLNHKPQIPYYGSRQNNWSKILEAENAFAKERRPVMRKRYMTINKVLLRANVIAGQLNALSSTLQTSKNGLPPLCQD